MKQSGAPKLFLLAIFTLGVWLQAICAPVIPPETLRYKVMFKWGLINKNAGSATLHFVNAPNNEVKATLIASSAPWADKIYALRDTLISYMDAQTMQPRLYERIANEDGKYSHDIITFHREGQQVTGEALRERRKKKGAPLTTGSTTLSATGPVVDMVSAFYYLRSLDFSTMTNGSETDVSIFSGKKKEKLQFKFLGQEEITIDGKKYSTFRVSFKFTTDGSKKSSEDIDAWLSVENPHVPIKLQGSLPVGKIQCILIDHTS